ncbi:hypothetical protein EYF80_018824 [Liparis tanakae]|uniref:Uncharacterized protein n=1 Tax=Liparis tanakae TaxID=230148 RepID=A0A4Z2HZB0_9TELE|nr:hypothetical protein EYF80_018824 [Liparis tanakae]
MVRLSSAWHGTAGPGTESHTTWLMPTVIAAAARAIYLHSSILPSPLYRHVNPDSASHGVEAVAAAQGGRKARQVLGNTAPICPEAALHTTAVCTVTCKSVVFGHHEKTGSEAFREMSCCVLSDGKLRGL